MGRARAMHGAGAARWPAKIQPVVVGLWGAHNPSSRLVQKQPTNLPLLITGTIWEPVGQCSLQLLHKSAYWMVFLSGDSSAKPLVRAYGANVCPNQLHTVLVAPNR